MITKGWNKFKCRFMSEDAEKYEELGINLNIYADEYLLDDLYINVDTIVNFNPSSEAGFVTIRCMNGDSFTLKEDIQLFIYYFL